VGFFHGGFLSVYEIKRVGCIFTHGQSTDEQIHDPTHRYGKVDSRPDHADGEKYRQIFQTAFLVVAHVALTPQPHLAQNVHTGEFSEFRAADIGNGVQ
jgi:hypothetical protein